MTEQEAVQAIEKYADEHGGGFTYEIDATGNVVEFEWYCFHIIGPPKEILWLKHAKSVTIHTIYGCDIHWVGAVEGIEYLHLIGFDNASRFPETWACASTLDYLSLSGKFDTIPPSIPQLKKLSFLHCYSINKNAELPDWDWLTMFPKLKTLNFCRSNIRSIPYSLVKTGLPFVIDDLVAKNCINLTQVQLEEGDLTLFGQPREVIEAYYKEGNLALIRECKVIFLGDGAAGKSCLIDRIINDHFDKDSPVTHGVRVTPWETEIQEKPFKLRVMDFGGQEILHSMHRCFLTAHTVYVVVCESRDDAEIDETAARWLDTVKAFAPGCPVILALNKADLNPNVSVNETNLKARNPDLKCVLKTSAAVGQGEKYGVNALTEAIREEIPGCINQYRANADMLAVKRALEDMTKDYITADEYRELCGWHHLTDPNLQHQMLGFFKELGVAYYYEQETGELDARLESVRVLNPAWLTNGIYRLIVRAPESGFLPHADIRDLLARSFEGDIDRKVYSAEETEFILHVMRQFEISHLTKPNGRAVEFIPLKMAKNTPEQAKQFPRDRSLHLRWEGIYLPNNLVHRLMIRKFSELDTKCVWRTGGQFWKQDGQCMALAEMNGNALDVYAAGERNVREYMESFRDEIQKILTLLNLKAEEYICTRIHQKEGRISYKSAMRQYHDGIERLFIEDIEEYIEPKELLKATYPDYLKEAERYRQRREGGFPMGPGEYPAEKPTKLPESEERKNNADAEKSSEEAKTIRLQRYIILALAVLALVLIVTRQWEHLEKILSILKGLFS